jgi:hypothetical protein
MIGIETVKQPAAALNANITTSRMKGTSINFIPDLSTILRHLPNPAQPRAGSFGMLYGLMEQQSTLLAYVDVLRLTAVLAFFCAPASWLFGKPKKNAKPPTGMH